MISYCKLLKHFLDRRTAGLSVGETETLIREIQSALPILHERLGPYSDDENAEHPNGFDPYETPHLRLAYIYRHLALRAHQMYQCIRNCGIAHALVNGAVENENSVQIYSIGGGPASELLGVASLLDFCATQRPIRLNFRALDIHPEWQLLGRELADCLLREEAEMFASLGIGMRAVPCYDLHEMNFANRLSGEVLAPLSDANLITCNYVLGGLSEAQRNDCLANLTEVVDNIGGRSFISMIDIGTLAVRNVFEQVQRIPGIVTLKSVQILETGAIPSLYQRSEANPYYSSIRGSENDPESIWREIRTQSGPQCVFVGQMMRSIGPHK